ncbi:MAG TPA: hypothetical protein V6C72_09160, partial [Chroococcales cyanobacterium]
IEPLPIDFHATGPGSAEASVDPPTHGVLRVILQEMTPDGHLRRTWAGGPPNGANMAKVFALSATQDGRDIPIKLDYDKIVWSGMSWALGEIDASDLTPGVPLIIRFHASEKDPITLKSTVYLVEY